jgi:hypothetical protein
MTTAKAVTSTGPAVFHLERFEGAGSTGLERVVSAPSSRSSSTTKRFYHRSAPTRPIVIQLQFVSLSPSQPFGPVTPAFAARRESSRRFAVAVFASMRST